MVVEKAYHSLSPANREEQPINILEVIGNASFGGMERYIINFLTHLPSALCQVTCICPYESSFTTSLRDLGYTVYILPITEDPVWRSIQFTSEIIRLHKIDVLHAHMPKAHTLAALAGQLVHTPVVSSVHGMHFSSYEFGVTRLAGSHLITNCQEAYGQVLGMGIPEEKVSLIHNGVDVQLFTPGDVGGALRKMIDVPEETPLVSFAGRLAYEKGPDLFLHAAQYIHYTRPDIHFVVVGKGDMENELKKMCGFLGLQKHVHFIGWHTDMASIYRSCDLLVYTSRSDGTSLVLLEAMACGCPIVALDVGGIREIVENDTTGLLSPPLDWEVAQFQVLDLLANPARLKSMKAAARLRVEGKFNLTSKVQSTIDVLHQAAFHGLKGQKTLNNGIMVPINGSRVSLDNSAAEIKL